MDYEYEKFVNETITITGTVSQGANGTVYITVNGHGDTVIMSIEQFNQISSEIR